MTISSKLTESIKNWSQIQNAYILENNIDDFNHKYYSRPMWVCQSLLVINNSDSCDFVITRVITQAKSGSTQSYYHDYYL